MQRTNRGSDRDVETQLRAARPEPTAQVTRAISDRVRPRRRGLMGGLARVPLVPVAGLTAVVVAVALALGGGPALSPAGDAQNLSGPAGAQYNNEVTICVAGFHTQTVSPESAAILVAQGTATYGPC